MWQYRYDGNGSLVEMTPGAQAGNGARRYSYNVAGQLVKVETHDGTAYQPQAEMAYDRQGQRLSLTGHSAGQSLTTHYLLDGRQTLAVTANGQTTYYLNGVGEYRTDWLYFLADGTNTARQIVDPQGQVTFRRSYTPWGEVLAQSGQADLSAGYLGGMLDAATGLIYMGNGQYYDPATGRFLTRSANQTNPYVPWKSDPAGAMLAPIALLAMIYGRKKQRGKWDTFAILLFFSLTFGIGLSACIANTSSSTPTQPISPTTLPTIEVTSIGTTVSATNTPIAASTAVKSPDVAKCDFTTVPTTNPKPKADENWEGITNVLWYEGASSFSEDLTEEVFRKTLWALRSEGKYDPSLYGWTYSDIVQSSRFSAPAHFNDKNSPWPLKYLDIAKQILLDQLNPPCAFDSEAVYFISTTHFLRLASHESNGSVYDLPQKITSSNAIMPSTCKDGNYCAFPEIRWRNDVKEVAKDSAERGISLSKGSYSFSKPTIHYNEYEECYWIGMYFNSWTNHKQLFDTGNNFEKPRYPAPNFDPGSSDAISLRCPVDLPQQ